MNFLIKTANNIEKEAKISMDSVLGGTDKAIKALPGLVSSLKDSVGEATDIMNSKHSTTLYQKGYNKVIGKVNAGISKVTGGKLQNAFGEKYCL